VSNNNSTMSSSLHSGSRDRTSTTNLTPERAAETIKNVASSIREASSKIREMVRTARETVEAGAHRIKSIARKKRTK